MCSNIKFRISNLNAFKLYRITLSRFDCHSALIVLILMGKEEEEEKGAEKGGGKLFIAVDLSSD